MAGEVLFVTVVGRLGCHVRQKSRLLCFSLKSAHHSATGSESPAQEELGPGGCLVPPQAWHVPRCHP